MSEPVRPVNATPTSDVRRQRAVVWALTAALMGVGIFLLLTCGSAKSGGTKGDFPCFYQAGVRLPLGENIYEKPPNAGEYIYPPLLAAIFTPLAKLGQARCAWAWAGINVAMLYAAVLLGARDVARRLRIGASAPVVLSIALLGLLLSIDKVKSVISGGQTDLIMVLGVGLGLVYHDRRPAIAGAALALAANVKYTPLIFVPYLLLRGQWRAAIWTLVFFVAFALAPASVVGWGRNIDLWMIALGGVARLFGYSGATEFAGSIRDASHHLSVSITSALSRALTPTLGNKGAMAASGLVALGVLAVSWRMYALRRIPMLLRPRDERSPTLAAIEWAGVIVAILAFSPQTQGRHFVMLLTLHLLAAGMVLRPVAGVPRLWLVLGLIVIQMGMLLPPSTPSMRGAVDAWRAIGGMGWCLLPLWFALLWTGLARATREPSAVTIDRTTSPAGGS